MQHPSRSATLAALLLVGVSFPARSECQVDSTTPRRRTFVLPVLGAAPETGFQFGVTAFLVREPAPASHTRPSSVVAYAISTTERQQRIGVDAERWTQGNRWRLAGTIQWQRFPLPFYGIGDRSPDSAKEIFTPRGLEIAATAQRRIAPSTFLLVGVRRLDQPISANDPTGVLRGNGVRGSQGGSTSQIVIGALDDTRDNLFAPKRGRFLQASVSWSDRAIGSDFSFTRTRIDLRGYVPVKPRHVLALQALMQATSGQPSFDQLTLIGGSDIMRGYARGRYRDRSLAAGQAEFRLAPVHRVGASVFAGAGTVAPTLGKLIHGRVLPTYGAGLRWQLDTRQRTAVRVDIGRGAAGASGLYVAFNEAF